ncbi:MAG: AEC family transporter [Phycisphaeraceae bacterium]|nr:AEC family transporter [Phycisphaeraceae bacterium]
MDPRTLRFLLFTAFGLFALLSGYTLRRRGWIREELARPIHFHTVLWFWSFSGILSFWLLPLTPEMFWFFLIVPVTVAVPTYSVIPLAKWIGCTRPQIGVMAIGAGICNGGITLGAYLSYCLLRPDHDSALAVAQAYAMLQLIIAVPFIYPVAQHFSSDEADKLSIPRLIVSSVFDVRSIGLFAGAIGLALSAAKVPYPQLLRDIHALDIVAYACAAGGYFGIGLRLRLGDSIRYLPQHAMLAGIKFIMIPLVCFMMLHLIGVFSSPLSTLTQRATMIEATAPTGMSMVVLANLFHLDARLASVLWVWNTVIFLMVPLLLILWWLG